MNYKASFALATAIVGGTLALSAVPAQAFTFTTNYTTTGSGNTATRSDVLLNSVTLSNGTVVDDFAYVNRAQILYNAPYSGGNTGAASADRGTLTTTGVRVEDPTNANVVTNLNNNNLNNIIDGEDQGAFRMNLFFDSLVDNVFIWERGMNSRIGVQAIDNNGNLLGNFLKLDSSRWQSAGFSIQTGEIGSAQRVGSLGVSLADLGVLNAIAGIRVSAESNYNGPDFKVVGSSAQPVPEPTTLLGSGLVAGAFAWVRRRRAAQDA